MRTTTATSLLTHLFLKCDKAKPARALRVAVDHHHSIGSLAKLFKVVAKVLLGHSGGQTTHENLLLLGIAAAAAAAATAVSATSSAAEFATQHIKRYYKLDWVSALARVIMRSACWFGLDRVHYYAKAPLTGVDGEGLDRESEGRA